MSIFDDIRKDAEAGTPEWRAEQPHFANGWWVVFTDPETDATVDQSGDGGFLEHTARRIARVPQLEAIALAAEELAIAVAWHPAPVPDLSAALDAFREATK